VQKPLPSRLPAIPVTAYYFVAATLGPAGSHPFPRRPLFTLSLVLWLRNPARLRQSRKNGSRER